MEEFQGVLGTDPDNPLARKMFGVLLYWKGRTGEALKELEAAAKLNPGDTTISEILGKIRKEYDIEKDYAVDERLHFTVSYDEAKDEQIGNAVVGYLEEAWQKVGGDFNFYPGEKIAVVIYSNRDFKGISDKAKNAGGLYDGKIRVPVRGLDTERDRRKLREALLHEYTHVVVHFLSHGRCPLWLNEGIAEYESTEFDARNRRRIERALEWGTFIPLAKLSAALREYDSPRKVELAYCEALSLVTFMAERYGDYNLRRLLDRLDGGADINSALGAVLNTDPNRLEREWRDWLGEK